ncbi:MAG: ABC transporter ATP-binding protein [Candidatus Dormiibacterota bacterium]
MTVAVEAHELTKDYGQSHGIFDLDLEVSQGEAFGLIGPNGAGKTTTLRLLMDLVRPTRGTAAILGMDTQRDSLAVKRVTAYVPGELPEYPNHTGERILDLFAHLRGGIDPARITALARRFDLDIHRHYREYSHGNKQKVWLIAAFMFDAQLYILDEPTNGLDPLMQQAFRELLSEAKNRGATVFLSSHVLPEVQEICDRIAVVHQGRLRQVGTMNDLRLSNIHHVEVRVTNPVDAHSLRRVTGVSAIDVSDHRMQCNVAGSVGPLLEALRPAGIVTIESAEMNLEQVFLNEYGSNPQP